MSVLRALRWAAFACSVGLLAPGAAVAMPAPAAPFSFDAAPGRLPKTIVPLDYTIDITPDAATKTIAGRESIVLLVREPTTTIVFNSLNERLTGTRFDGMTVTRVDSDDARQMTTVTLAQPAPAGRHTLTFAYTGTIETAPYGLFAQPYAEPNGGPPGTLISTKFEATDARRMFPCWDEPAFRATYTLSATVPAAWTTISNMPIAKRVDHGPVATTTFARSPKMPSYLVEFSAGDFAEISAQSGATKLNVWTIRGQENAGRVALANAQQILADDEAYFGYAFPLPKLDAIAIPGGYGGAMENWGAITYNDELLLVTPSSSIAERQLVYKVQAHEMAHQWNGDLVTMGWWDDLWLNESFASWRSAKETDLRNPTWKWWEVQDDDKEGAMAADALITSHAIQQHVTDELQAKNAFDPEITYSKGQAVLRMLEAYLGPDTFRDGIRAYIKARAFSNATAADLWNGKNVADIASSWIGQPGFPLVSVKATCDANDRRTVRFAQKRFLLRGAAPASSHWNVPLSIRSGVAGAPQTLLLTRDGQTADGGSCREPFSANAGGVGYYRVAYDVPTLAVNAENFAALIDSDKIVMLDDQWAQVQSGAATLPSYLKLAQSMGGDLDASAWKEIAASLEIIEEDERGMAGHDRFVAYARSLIKPIATQLGWDAKPGETPDVTELRHGVLAELGAWGDAATIAEANKRFAAFVTDRKSVAADDERTLLAIVAINADAATFAQLHALAKSAKDEAELSRYYFALMRVRDPELAQRALSIALSDELPPQLAGQRVWLVGVIQGYHPQLAWRAFTKNVDVLIQPLGEHANRTLAQDIPEMYWNAVPLADLQAWLKAHLPAEMAPELSHGMEFAAFSADQRAALVPAADAYVAAAEQR